MNVYFRFLGSMKYTLYPSLNPSGLNNDYLNYIPGLKLLSLKYPTQHYYAFLTNHVHVLLLFRPFSSSVFSRFLTKTATTKYLWQSSWTPCTSTLPTRPTVKKFSSSSKSTTSTVRFQPTNPIILFD